MEAESSVNNVSVTKIEYVEGQPSMLVLPDFFDKLNLEDGDILQWVANTPTKLSITVLKVK